MLDGVPQTGLHLRLLHMILDGISGYGMGGGEKYGGRKAYQRKHRPENSEPHPKVGGAQTNVQHRFVLFFLLSFLLFCSPGAKALCFEGESPGGKILKNCEKCEQL